MTGRLTAALVVTMICGVGTPGPAAASPAEWLREICADGELYYAYGACSGYLMARLDADRAAEGRFCPPPDVTIFSLPLDIEPALADLPALADEDAAGFSARLLAATYPCD